MDLSEEILRNKTLLVILNEEQYEDKIGEISKSLNEIDKKICYVCLNKPYKDVIGDLENQNANMNKFFFIDVLSSYYERQEPVENCIFVPSRTDLVSIMNALVKAVREKKCEVVVLDTISTFQVHKEDYLILEFAYNVLQKKLKGKSRKVLITLRGGDILGKEREELIEDLKMLINLSITLENKKEKNFSDEIQIII